MTITRLTALITLTMVAFAGNSLLCRLALKGDNIDPASFTTVRLVSGALTLWFIARLKTGSNPVRSNWLSAGALFLYAVGFSFAYVSLPAATGGLLLFASVQVTMVGYGYWKGERLSGVQISGAIIAFTGVIILFLPGASTPSISGSILMLGAGVGWGVYSLRGKRDENPLGSTTGNFLLAAPMAGIASLITLGNGFLSEAGFWYAILSGALASGGGYALWYSVLPFLKYTSASVIQLSVPAIIALSSVALLNEPITLRLGFASLAILGGVALVVLKEGE